MAIFRLEAKIISRGGGKSTVASAAYRTGGKSAMSAAAYRAGQKLLDERTGEVHDYTQKRGILGAEIILPVSAPAWMLDRQKLWNHIETVVEKRKDAQLAYDYIISIPHELSRRGRIDVIRDFVREQFVDKGFVADVAWHEPGKGDQDLNVHAHVMVTMRRIEDGAFTAVKDRPPPGEHPMIFWQSKLRDLRVQWELTANRHLEMAGLDVRIDHRSLEDRGIDREAQPKLGPVATKRERDKLGSHAGDDLRAVKARNAERDQLKVELAKAVADEAEIIDLLAARERRAGMALSPEELGREQFARQEEAANRIRTEEQEAEERLRLDAEHRLKRIDTMKLEQEQFAGEAKRHLDAIKEEDERRRLDGKITSAEARYAIAVGETVSSSPYDSFIRAAGAESAAFVREQEAMRQQLSDPKLTGEKRQELTLRKQIEYLEYRAITDERVSGLYQVIGGREHLAQADIRAFYANEAREKAKELRAERQQVLNPELAKEGPAKEPADQVQRDQRRENNTAMAVRQSREMLAAEGDRAKKERLRGAQKDEKAERQEFADGLQTDRRVRSQETGPAGQPDLATRGERGPGGATDRSDSYRDGRVEGRHARRQEEETRGATSSRDAEPVERTDAAADWAAGESSRELSDEHREWVSRLEAIRDAKSQANTEGRSAGKGKSGGRGI